MHMGVILNVPVQEGQKKGILTKQGTYIMAILGTGMLNNYHRLLVKPWMHIHEEWHRQQQQQVGLGP